MKKVYLSQNAKPLLVEYLKALGYDITFVYATSHTHESISAHPDIYLCKLGFHKMFYGKPELLKFDYPENIRYNAVCMGNYFIHKLENTDEDLLIEASHSGKTLINVPQGYTKCNIAVVDECAAITSDLGIAEALGETDIDLLVITAGHILLKDFPYGFIGGASGRVGSEMIFHGNLSVHPDFDKIADFLAKHDCGLKYFEEFELEDIGSIIEA